MSLSAMGSATRPTLRSFVAAPPLQPPPLARTRTPTPPPDACGAGDYASLFQKPRTEAMDQLFGKGLKSSNIWRVSHALSPLPAPLHTQPHITRAAATRAPELAWSVRGAVQVRPREDDVLDAALAAAGL